MMFDSPLEYCRIVGDYVAIDQTERECAAEHGCERAPGDCPLASHFGHEPARGAREAVEVESAL